MLCVEVNPFACESLDELLGRALVDLDSEAVPVLFRFQTPTVCALTRMRRAISDIEVTSPVRKSCRASSRIFLE